MLKLSIDNPIILPLFILFFGMLGYVYEISKINSFDILFVSLQFILILFLFFIAIYLERKEFPDSISVNNLFSWFVIAINVFFLILIMRADPVQGFDDRLSIFNSSFLLGMKNALSFFLFPLIPALTNKKLIFRVSIAVWVLTSLFVLFYAPSKSFFITTIFSILSYRFIKRKTGAGMRRIPLLSFWSFFTLLFVMSLTYWMVYQEYGSAAFDIIMHRASYNYDIAIYISSIYEYYSPEKGIFYYAVLPLIKQFNHELYDLDFFSISQWTLYHALGIDRFGRFGYPNDNLAAGMILSYGALSIPVFVMTFFFWYVLIKFILSKNKTSIFSIYLIFKMPLFYSSLQDFSIYFYTVVFLYFSFKIATIILFNTNKIGLKKC